MATGDTQTDFFSRFNAALDDGIKKIGTAISLNMDMDAIVGAIKEVDEAALGITSKFGQARENIMVLKQQMSAAVTDVTLLGGGFEDIAKIQEEIGETLGRNLVLTSESYERLYAATKVSGQSVDKIASSFKDAGISVYQSATEMEKVVNTARGLGVSAEAVSSKVLSNMDALNKFSFEGGVTGLAKMAAQATLLRVDMKESLDLALELYNPEKAIDLAAAMQRLGVANSELLDPLRLMDLAQNNPEELQNQIVNMTKQFVQMNDAGKFEILPGARRQLMEISKELGIPYEQLTKMAIGAEELNQKMSQIKFPEGAFTEEQKNLIANMAEMGEDGQFKIAVEGEGEMNLQDAIVKFQEKPELLEALQKAGEPKKLEDLAAEQLTVAKSMEASLKSLVRTPYAIAGTKVAQDAYTAPQEIMKGMANTLNTEALSIKNITKGFGESAEDILNSINKIIKGEGSMKDLADTVTKAGEGLKNFGPEALKQSMEKYDESIAKLADSNNIFVDIMLEGAKKVKDAFLKYENLGGTEKNTEVKVEDFVIKTLPEDKLVMAGGTKLGETQTPQMMNTKMDVNMNLNITAPPNIDTAQLILALENTNVKEAMVQAVSKGRYNNGLTASDPNSRKMLQSMADLGV